MDGRHASHLSRLVAGTSARAGLTRRRTLALGLVASLLASLGTVAPTSPTIPAASASEPDGSGGTIWYVGPGGGTDGDACDQPDFTVGLGYDTSSGAIASAVATAAPGDTVFLCDFEYHLTDEIGIAKDLTLEGESSEGTIVDASGVATGYHRAFTAPDNVLVLVRLTVQGGTGSFGGAVYGGHVHVRDVLFKDNHAAIAGGAIRANGVIDATGATFIRNTAGSEGGALSAPDGSVWVDHGRFEDNSSCYGGAIEMGSVSGSTAIESSTFDGNVASSASASGCAGGAIFSNGVLAIADSRFADNLAQDEGGAVWSYSAVSVVDSEIIGNRVVHASSSGLVAGGGIAAYGPVSVDSSEFRGNSVASSSAQVEALGGAIATRRRLENGTTVEAPVVMTDSTLTENSVVVSVAGGTAKGGALYGESSVTIVGSSLSDNTASAYTAIGGGIYAGAGRHSIAATLFERNSAATQGNYSEAGALFTNGPAQVVRAEFDDNGAGSAGAVEVNGALSMSDSVFNGNRAAGGAYSNYAGALWAYGPWSIVRSRFVGNSTAPGKEFSNGGAVFANGGDGSLIDSTFVGNRAGDRGGAIALAPSGRDTAWISGSSFVGNRSVRDGGAIYSWSVATHVTNSTFAENTAGVGGTGAGTIYAVGSDVVDLRNLTLTGNEGSGGFGGIVSVENYGSAPAVSLGNSILGGAGDACSLAQPVTDLGGNIAVTDGTSACVDPGQSRSRTTAHTSDLAFGALVEDDGPTPVMPIGADSVAKEYGLGRVGGTLGGELLCTEDADPWSVTGVDQRGVTRPQDAACDAGAYEVERGAGAFIVGAAGGSGTCADYPTIAAAIVDAHAGDTVHVCGRHRLTGGIGVDKPLTFVGDSSAGTVVDGGGKYRIFDARPGDDPIDITVGTMTLRNGWTSDVAGGSAVIGDRVTIENAIVRDSRSAGFGGAIRSSGTTVIRGSRFVGNVGLTCGGALCSSSSDPLVIEGSRFESNEVTFTAGAAGAVSANGPIHVNGSSFARNVAPWSGGAIAGTDAVDVSASTFVGNRAGRYGGALSVSGDLSVSDSTFVGNTSPVEGGAIYAERSVAVRDATFLGNSAGAWGGAIASLACAGDPDSCPDTNMAVRITTSVFADNTAGTGHGEAAGGAIHATAPVIVRDTDFTGNLVRLGPGGAISSNRVAVLGGTFEDNHAWSGGAIVGVKRVDVTAATFVANEAWPGSGGAIGSSGLVSATNATFYQNLAVGGSGGAIDASAASVRFSTFRGGYAVNGGGAIRATGAATLDHVLLAGGSACAIGSVVDTGGSVETGSTCGLAAERSNVPAPSLKLGPLGDNGGDTWTIAIRSGSAAIDTTKGASCSVALDQRGHSRPDAGGCDAGAYEAGPETSITLGLAVGSGARALTSGDRSITSGDTVTMRGTVTGAATNPSGSGLIDPTSGSVRFFYCWDELQPPTECTEAYGQAAGTSVQPGPGVAETDGTAVAMLAALPPFGHWDPGWYLVGAIYDSGDGAYAGSDTSGDLATSLFRVGSPVAPTFTGPWVVNSSTTVRSLALSATLDPPTPGCAVTFSLGDPASVSAEGVSAADGSVSASLANVAPGTYQVTVDVAPGGSCLSAGPVVSSLLVAPGTVAKGMVGGGWYRLGDASWARNDVSVSVAVTSTYDKRSKLTTTTTRGDVLWVSDAPNALGRTGWRLRASFAATTTDGTSVWQPRSCTSPVACGRLVGTRGLLEQWTGKGWTPATAYGSAGRVTFSLSVSDGGTTRTCVKKMCRTADNPDFFGLTIEGVGSPAAATDRLPQVGAPSQLRSGSLAVF